jgi:hypothetical protein
VRAAKFGGFLLGLIWLVTGCQWVLGDFTLDKSGSTSCPHGAAQCVGNVLQTCTDDGTAWRNVAVCASATLCDATHAACQKALCADGDKHCQDSEFQVCKSTRDGWTDVQSCGSAAQCSVDSGCTAQPCQPGTHQCNGAVFQTCNDDQSGWHDDMTCASAALCSKDGCAMGVCASGQYQCAGAELQACNDALNGWTTVKTCDSPMLCNQPGATCNTAACTNAGAYRCSETGVLERCADDLTGWVMTSTCQGAAYCDAANGACTTQPCTPGTYQCSGAELDVCNADSSGWKAVDTCETEGLCQQTLGLGATTCAKPTCMPGATQCDNGVPEVCAADRTGFKANGPACATPDLCNAGSGTCTTPICDPGQVGCKGAQPTICNAGRTDFAPNGAACASSALCNMATGTCGNQTCFAGQLRCDPANPTNLQRCNDDLTAWDPTPCDTCATAELCSASLGAATCDATSCQEPVCVAGTPSCGDSGTNQGIVLQVCNSGRTGYTPCDTCATSALCSQSLNTKPFSCMTGACTQPSCAPTDLWCGGTGNTTLYQCPPSRINSQPTVLGTCATNGLCELSHSKNETTCEAPTCSIGDLWCGGTGNTTLYQCPASRINSQPTLLGTCATNGLCELSHSKNETTCEAPTCTANAFFCGGTGNKSLYQCPASRIASQATALDTCITSGLCNLTSSKSETKCEAPVCSAGATRCGGTAMSTLQMCNTDRTGFTDCATCTTADLCTASLGATSCSSSACLVCAAGATQCDTDGNFETCKADGSGFTITDCMGAGCDDVMGCL